MIELMLRMEDVRGKDMQALGRLCAATLRLAKKMSENAGISATPVQDTR